MNTAETGKVTATVTSGVANSSGATVQPSVEEFLGKVVPWPVNGAGHVNLHYSMLNLRNPGGKDIVTGKPFQSVGDFLKFACWAVNTNTIKEVWFCTSLQSQADKNSKGNPKAKRLHQNALLLKSIWIDIDVKSNDATGKHYLTIADAWDAITKFRAAVGLPQFSAVVSSGGGLHIYWISKTPMTPDVWRPYAEGLKALLLQHGIKCDAGVTTDDVRLLRVPGTLNHKYTPPRPVQLMPLPLREYDFTAQLALLTVAAPTSGKSAFNPFFDDAAAARFVGVQPCFTGDDKLSDGIGPRKQMTLLDPRPIFDGCAFLREALTNGGKEHENPLWNLTNLAATFMEDGNKLAHAMSRDHASYTFAETQAQYDRKVAERQSQGLGYPSCAAIQSAGCKLCATCPLFAKGKSPLNLGLPSAAQHPDDATEAASGPTASAQHPDDATEAASGPTASPPPELKVSFAHIPHRPWLYAVDLVRKDITLMASPGGAGKTSLALGMAACLATGKALLGEKIWGSDPLKSLYINAEDSRVEMLRRACAFCQQHGISELELDRLHLIGADDPRVQGISFLRAAGPSSSILDQAGFAQLEGLLISLRPDLTVLDPLIALSGGGNVNDNAVMSLVMRELKKLAMKYNCAILIVLHTTKGGDLSNANAISGASAIKDLARHAIMPVTMTEDERKVFRLLPSERRQYFKLVDAKSNLAPLSGETWYRLENQELPNAEPPTYPHGDRVQAVVRANLTSSKASSAVDPKRETIRFELLKLIERGLMIDGESVPYSPNSTGKNKMRAILDHAMAAVRGALADREYSPADLRAVAERELEALKHDGWAVVEPIKKGRFRRSQGLRPVWERTPWAKERAALHEHGGPTVRTEDEERELHRSDLEEFLRD